MWWYINDKGFVTCATNPIFRSLRITQYLLLELFTKHVKPVNIHYEMNYISFKRYNQINDFNNELLNLRGFF